MSTHNQLITTAKLNNTNVTWSKHQINSLQTEYSQETLSLFMECNLTNTPLQILAKEHGIDFTNFHFSYKLREKLNFDELSSPPIFEGISACNCFIDTSWVKGGTSFKNSDLSNAKFYKSSEDGLIVPGTHLFEADFSGANLAGADLRLSYLRGSCFVGANIQDTDFRYAVLHDADFTDAIGKAILGDVAWWGDVESSACFVCAP